MDALIFDPVAHVYTVNGKRVPSVTQLLEPIKPDFSMVPADVLEAKRALGVAVHEACEFDDEGELDEDSLPDVVVPYLQAWRKFRAETGAAIVMNEQRLYHPALHYAGTLDRFAHIDGKSWMLDIKTSIEAYPSYGVQLAGYVELLRGAGGVGVTDPSRINRAAVQLASNGTYRFVTYKNPNDSAAFMACLSLFNWKESQK